MDRDKLVGLVQHIHCAAGACLSQEHARYAHYKFPAHLFLCGLGHDMVLGSSNQNPANGVKAAGGMQVGHALVGLLPANH